MSALDGKTNKPIARTHTHFSSMHVENNAVRVKRVKGQNLMPHKQQESFRCRAWQKCCWIKPKQRKNTQTQPSTIWTRFRHSRFSTLPHGLICVSFREIKIWLNASRWLVYVKVYQEKPSMSELQWVTVKVRTPQQPDPVYHRGRPEHWHWTLSHLKEGGGTAQGLSLDTKGEAPKMAPWKNIIQNSSLMHDAAMKKHAAKSLLETKAERSSHQTTLRSSIKRQPALKRSALMDVFAFLLPFSKNSDRRFKFFRDMDSDSTWEMENRFQRATLKSNKNTYFNRKQFFLIL